MGVERRADGVPLFHRVSVEPCAGQVNDRRKLRWRSGSADRRSRCLSCEMERGSASGLYAGATKDVSGRGGAVAGCHHRVRQMARTVDRRYGDVRRPPSKRGFGLSIGVAGLGAMKIHCVDAARCSWRRSRVEKQALRSAGCFVTQPFSSVSKRTPFVTHTGDER